MTRRRILIFAFTSLFVRAAYAQEPSPKQKVLVIQTLATDRSDKELDYLAQDLTEHLVVHAASLGKPRGLIVRSESEMRIMIQELKDLSDVRPEDYRKIEEYLARMFEDEADEVLRGEVGTLGDTYFVALKLIDLKSKSVVRWRSCGTEGEGELVDCLKQSAAELLGYVDAPSPTAEVTIPSDGRKIGVVPIKGTGADEQNAHTLTEMASEAILRFGFGVQTKSDIISMIHYAADRSTLTGTPLSEAIMEIARGSDVSMLVFGNIGRVEKTHLIALKLVDLKKGEVVNRVLESYVGPESQLGAAMRFACARLFGRAPSGEGGPLTIVADVDGQYRIDARRPESLPQATATTSLEAGKHVLSLRVDGYYPYSSDFYLSELESLKLRPELEEVPRWYDSPLVWSIAGVAAVGAATAIVFAVIPKGVDARSGLEP